MIRVTAWKALNSKWAVFYRKKEWKLWHDGQLYKPEWSGLVIRLWRFTILVAW